MKIKINLFFRELDFDYQVEIYFVTKLVTFNKELVKGKNSQKYGSFLKIPNLLKIVKFSKIEKFLFQVKIGLIEILPTIYAVPLLSTILAGFLTHYRDWIENADFAIQPVYNELKFDFKLECIAKIKLVHIIYIIIRMMKKGVNQDGRASN